MSIKVGDTITARCVTMGSAHTGKVLEVRRWAWEYSPRYLIECEDGRQRIVM